ncbi:hypothetical protein KEU06_08960 [Pseudaminobacter sp. 19-2017]|uniref:Uncharacterized protein n=1 Tax=Pseudaminobacter soli (ex Zhang et al. 2022) TaxID=2831468 RepID=A0A942DXE0_9HYPH|nr:hypothetical protein [Pseudaminobacter soli]MBS3648757.1 hypothetical protein [Pseudaminobacter soli]
MTEIQKLERAINQVLAEAKPGDVFLCCAQHVGDCPHYAEQTCDCPMITITEETTAAEVVALYQQQPKH